VNPEPDEVSIMENSIQGSARSLIKIIFLRSYIFQLKKAIEDGDVAAESLTISSLARLIDSSIFGSSSERIAGIEVSLITIVVHYNERSCLPSYRAYAKLWGKHESTAAAGNGYYSVFPFFRNRL
jgi:hypothetical protein